MTTWSIWYKAAGADTWSPLSPYQSLPVGHYQVAARLPVAFKALEWRWTFYPQVGAAQSYHFQGQTNEEGLISLLDLDTALAGTWRLIGLPDVFDTLCGEYWQLSFQFQMIARLPAPLLIPPFVPAANAIVPHFSPEPALASPSPSLEFVDHFEACPSVENQTAHREADLCEIAELTEDSARVTGEEDQAFLSELLEPIASVNEETVLAELGGNDESLTLAEFSLCPDDFTDPPEAVSEEEEPADFTDLTDLELTNNPENWTPEEPLLPHHSLTLAEPEFASLQTPQPFSIGDRPLRPVNYSLELTYPETHQTIQVDVTILTTHPHPHRKPLSLPAPKPCPPMAYRSPVLPYSPLPPKLKA